MFIKGKKTRKIIQTKCSSCSESEKRKEVAMQRFSPRFRSQQFFLCVNLSLEELKNIYNNTFSNTRTRNRSLFNQLGHRVNAASRRSLEFSSVVYHKNQEPIRNKNLPEKYFSATLIHYFSKRSGGSIVL